MDWNGNKKEKSLTLTVSQWDALDCLLEGDLQVNEHNAWGDEGSEDEENRKGWVSFVKDLKSKVAPLKEG